MATRAQKERRARAEQAAAITATAGVLGVPLPAPRIPDIATRARGAAAILDLLGNFHAQIAKRDEVYLSSLLGPQGEADDVAQVIAAEKGYGEEFARRQRERVKADMVKALALPDAEKRSAAVQQILARERHYVRLRQQMMTRRASAAMEMVNLQALSPQGAFWQLSDRPGIVHCVRCLAMGQRAWPWVVLKRVRLPLHGNCECRLRSIGDALQEGLMQPGDIPSAADALRMAAGVAMEAEDAEALLHECDALDALVTSGQLTADVAADLLG